jgi:hypothetical protein
MAGAGQPILARRADQQILIGSKKIASGHSQKINSWPTPG